MILIMVMLFINASIVLAQNSSDDFNLLKENTPSGLHPHTHHVEFGIANNRNAFIKYNPVTLSLSTLMFTYQKWVSPQVSSNCYFEPTCSRYSVLLFKQFGIVKGTLATADRLMRCDRISATTFHPISFSTVDGKIHETPNRYVLHEE
ncbi:MAG: membrane protein insertion efficiency factor YidD [Salinivirgaceae bacterium]|nr:membrane protein insertion efficiency factor YidD [Salinivirgaceae bacterium]